MATELGTYYISLVPTASNISGHITRQFAPAQAIASTAGQDAGARFSEGFHHATQRIGSALATTLKVGTVAATAAVAAAGAIGVKTAAQLETANIAFTTMLGSGEEASKFMGELERFAKRTPFDLPGLQKSASQLVAIGIQSDKIIPIMTTLGNVTSGMGTGSEGIKRAVVALQQMNAAGKITAEDLNQLRDAGIPVYDLLTAATGKSKEEISKMRDEGKLGREELNALMDALETGRGFEKFNGLMEKQSQSLTGLWETLKDTFGVGMARAMEPGLQIAKDNMAGLTSWLDSDFFPALTIGLERFAGFLNEIDWSSFSSFWASISHIFGPFAPVLSQIFDHFIALAPAVEEFGRQLARIAPDLVVVGLTILSGVLGFLADHVDFLVAIMPALVYGFAAWRLATLAVFAAHVLAAGAVAVMGVVANASAGAGKVAAAAQWLWNASLYGFPLVWVIVAVAALVAGIIWLATQTEWGRDIMAACWEGLKWVWQGVVDFWNGIVVPIFTNFISWLQTDFAPIWNAIWDGVGVVLTWLWENIVSPVFGHIGNWISWVWNSIIVPVFTALDWYVRTILGPTIVWLWENVVKPAFDGIGATIGWVWENLIKPPFDAFNNFLNTTLGPTVTWFNEEVVQPQFNAASSTIDWLWNNIIAPALAGWDWFMRNILGPTVTWLGDEVIGPVFGRIGETISFVWNAGIQPIFWAIQNHIENVLSPAWTAAFMWMRIKIEDFQHGVTTVWNWLSDHVFGPMMFMVRTLIPEAFAAGVKNAEAMWKGLELAVKIPVKFVVDKVINEGLIGTFNTLARILGMKEIPPVVIPGFEVGGYTGRGGKYEPAGVVHKKEFVLRSEATDRLRRTVGLSGLNFMNKTGQLPEGFARGGFVDDKDMVDRKRRKRRIPADAEAYGAGAGRGQAMWSSLQDDIFRARKLHVTDPGRNPASVDMAGALRMWNNQSGNAQLNFGPGNPGVRSMWANNGGANWWGLAEFGPRTIKFASNSGLPGASLELRRAVAAHEVGHMLGLPHVNSRNSIMHPMAGQGSMRPTSLDRDFLRSLYPGPDVQANLNGATAEGGWNPFQGVLDVIDGLKKQFFPNGGLGVDLAFGMAKHTVTMVKDWAESHLDGLFGGGELDTGAMAGVAQDALSRTGAMNPENMRALVHRINQESSGDPRAINNWDSNARMGTPTKGLMQLLDQNFRVYRDKSLPDDIFHPLANVVAAINYTRHRYAGRSLSSVWMQPGGYASGGLVYDSGGWLEQGIPAIHKKKKPDAVLTDSQWDAMYSIAAERGEEEFHLHVHGEGQSPETIGTLAARTIVRKRGRR